jgi:hypothetical protein
MELLLSIANENDLVMTVDKNMNIISNKHYEQLLKRYFVFNEELKKYQEKA